MTAPTVIVGVRPVVTEQPVLEPALGRVTYDPECRRCDRLVAFLARVRKEHPDYHCRPVPAFGDPSARLLVVGLAPGKHGANASGRPFTGDHAGILLYETLHRFGFANRPQARCRDDGLRLLNCRVTNAVKCLPPDNKPLGAEVRSCNAYLGAELATLAAGAAVVALGTLAHAAIVRALRRQATRHPFAHAREHHLGSLTLLDSYHCSRYNTQTGRLTEAMFRQVFARARQLVKP